MRGGNASKVLEPLASISEPLVNDVPLRYARSPLRYPGGKSRAVPRILPLIPSDTKTICSPFVGGASIEIACAARGMQVRGYDIFTPLVDFWQSLLYNPTALADRVEKYYPLERVKFYRLQKRYITLTDSLERAAVFYALNRASFSGLTLSGGMSPGHPRFTPASIEKLRKFDIDDFTVNQSDYTVSIASNPDAFLYLDPPYKNGQKLYGIKGDTHEDFDHQTLKELLDQRGQWILSYNDCPEIRQLYKKYQILDTEWQYGMSASKQSSEIVIVSHDLEVAA